MKDYREHPYCIESRALKAFGETDSLEFAGYILPDGTMLNFAPAGWQRTEDHRAIGRFFKSAEGWKAVVAFMRRGNVRVNCSRDTYGFEYIEPLTSAQRRVMAEAEAATRWNGAAFCVDVSDRNGKTVSLYQGDEYGH